MFKFIERLLFQDQPDTVKEEIHLTMVHQSQKALTEAAISTMDLAKDVTETLRGRLDDYVNQIEMTSKILNDALIVVDSFGIIEQYNQSAERIFGWTVEEMKGNHITRLFASGIMESSDLWHILRSNETGLLDSAISTQGEVFLRYGMHKNGQLIDLEMSISRLRRSDNTILFILLVRDITERLLAQKRIESDKAYLTAILNAIPDMVITTNREHIITDIHPPGNVCHCMSYIRSGMSLMEAFGPSSEVMKTTANMVYATGMMHTFDYTIYCEEEDDIKSFEGRSVLCDDLVVTIIRDVSEIARLEAELEEALED